MSGLDGFNLQLPLVCAPMFLVSGPDMVVAASKAGIGGAFPSTNCRTLGELEQWLATITAEVSADDGPWILNLITHSSRKRLTDELRLVAEYRPPIVITALGSPKPVMETVKGYGGLVFADVVNLALARKAAEAGVDGMACISAGAGGHTGQLSPFAFIAAIRDMFQGVIAIGGGIADGYGIAGAVAAGADCVYMGTRFIATQESLAAERYKTMVLESGIEDLVVSSAVTGTSASWLKASLAEAGFTEEALTGQVARDYSGSDAKRWRDVWAAGQGVGSSRVLQSVASVVADLKEEYRAGAARLNASPLNS